MLTELFTLKGFIVLLVSCVTLLAIYADYQISNGYDDSNRED